MADISTGRQRGIVPFVDETTGRLPDQYLPQGVIDLQGDLEQAVTNASASATEAKASAASATQSASAAAQSAESASGDAAAAKASADGAASSASAAKASETAAASSATAAANSEVAAKESETAASQSAQTATEQVSSIGDSVERAAASATAAQQSATEAASSASNASQSASSASTSASQAGESASQASGFASAASQAATTATGAASNASASATTAHQSASDASASASAAKTSETNAASSASAAKVSETNAAASATAAREAVDGFGLEVGTTTTGEPNTDAIVNIVKQGTKYVADFTIPRGADGQGGSGGLPTISHDTTLTGDGTSGSPLGLAARTFLTPTDITDLNTATEMGVYEMTTSPSNSPAGSIRGFLIVGKIFSTINLIVQLAVLSYTNGKQEPSLWTRNGVGGGKISWNPWHRVDVTDYVANATYQALETRVQALEAKLANQ